MSNESISIPVSPEMRALITVQFLESEVAAVNRSYAALNEAFKRTDARAVKQCLDSLAANLADTAETVRHLDLVLFVATPEAAPDA